MDIFDISRRLGGYGGNVNFQASDADDENDVRYYGFLSTNGAWIILKEDRSGSPKTYRYAGNKAGYGTAWTDRVSLTYTLFSELVEG